MRKSSGAIANASGKKLEELVATEFSNRGYYELTKKEDKICKRLIKDNKCEPIDIFKPFGRALFVRQIRLYRNLYGFIHMSDIFAFHPVKHPEGIIVEVKWQAASGSADEKWPYVIESLKNMPGLGIFVFEGGGAKNAAVAWAIKQARDDLIIFTSVGDLSRWGRKNL